MTKEEQRQIAQNLVDRYGSKTAKEIAAEIYALCFRFIPDPEPVQLPTLTQPNAHTQLLGHEPTDAQRLAAMMLRAGVELVTPMQPPAHHPSSHLWQRLPSKQLSSQSWPSPLRSSPHWQTAS